MYENNNVNNTTEQPEEEAARTPVDTFLLHQKRALEETGKALDALVRRLRDRLAEVDKNHDYVVTVRGHGIRMDNPPLEA